MARFADRFRRGEPAPERPVERAPASLLSVEPDLETEPAPERIEGPVVPPSAEAVADPRPALLRKLAGERDPPRKRFGLLPSAKGDDTILAASPSRSRVAAPRIGSWMARLTGEGPPQALSARDDIIEDAFEDVRRQIDRPDAPSTGDLHDAEKRLTLALSKAGWLAEEIAKCNAALEDARRLIRDEELKLARLRGLHEGIGGQSDAERPDLDAIQETLETLRRMVRRLDEPR